MLQVGPLESFGPWFWSVVAQDVADATTNADTSYFFLHSSGSVPMVESIVLGRPFPNPAASVVKIPTFSPVRTSATVELVNLVGRVVLAGEKVIPVGRSAITWALPSEVPEGAYVVRVRYERVTRQFSLLLMR